MLPHSHTAKLSSTEMIKKKHEDCCEYTHTVILNDTIYQHKFAGLLIKLSLIKMTPVTFPPVKAQTQEYFMEVLHS